MIFQHWHPINKSLLRDPNYLSTSLCADFERLIKFGGRPFCPFCSYRSIDNNFNKLTNKQQQTGFLSGYLSFYYVFLFVVTWLIS